MPKEETLKKIDKEIADGDLGKARERLHGLITGFPNDLSLRKKLGEIYFKLQYPERAGKFWFLEEDKTEEMQYACSKFKRLHHDDSLSILKALRFRGDINQISSEFAKKLLGDLCNKCQEIYEFRHNRHKKDKPFWEHSARIRPLSLRTGKREAHSRWERFCEKMKEPFLLIVCAIAVNLAIWGLFFIVLLFKGAIQVSR